MSAAQFARLPVSRRSVVLVAAAVLVGVVAVAATQLWDPTAVKGSFQVAGRGLYLECVGKGAPTIVMEAGSGRDHETWSEVVSQVRGSNRTCTYDRANTGQSDALAGTRSSADVAVELHALLETARIAPPYILVGHSLGGISMRLFAATYADEVKGLVLVDATPTTFVEDACAVVDAIQCSRFRTDFEPEHNNGIDIADSEAAVVAAAPLRPMPVVVLVAGDHGHDAFTPELRQQFEVMWLGRQQEVADSVEGGRLQHVDGGHNIQTQHPEIVVAAIAAVTAQLATNPS
jgi:pimeloyl-ACP methyl ester carboxylesterase